MSINNTRLVTIPKILIKETNGNERLSHFPTCTNIKQPDDVAFIKGNALQKMKHNTLKETDHTRWVRKL